MTEPTVGQLVLYRPKDYAEDVRFAAQIARVNEDGTINIGYLNAYGVHENEQHVKLVNDDPATGQCEWMAHQKEYEADYKARWSANALDVTDTKPLTSDYLVLNATDEPAEAMPTESINEAPETEADTEAANVPEKPAPSKKAGKNK